MQTCYRSTQFVSLYLLHPYLLCRFFDLLRIFDLNGLPSETNPYLFNGA